MPSTGDNIVFKIAHMPVVSEYVSLWLWLCGFVTLYVQMFVAGANKVEGYYELMLGNQ